MDSVSIIIIIIMTRDLFLFVSGKQQLESLTKVCVRNEDVGFIGETLQEIAPNLVEVDLQDNLLWQWNEVRSMVS